MRRFCLPTLAVGLLTCAVIAPPVQADPPPQWSYKAHLSGKNERPDPAPTRAQGQAHFKLSKDGTYLYYKLNVANINNVRMAHIHLVNPDTTLPATDSNGPVVVWLYPDAPPPVLIPGRFSGVLAEGIITSDDLGGPLADMTLEDLLLAMELGLTYVNVHTQAFPAGEIRGQID